MMLAVTPVGSSYAVKAQEAISRLDKEFDAAVYA